MESKCWWNRLSDLCYLVDKASPSELQSVKGDRITKMMAGPETDTVAGWGWPWRLGRPMQLHADVVRDATQVRKLRGRGCLHLPRENAFLLSHGLCA